MQLLINFIFYDEDAKPLGAHNRASERKGEAPKKAQSPKLGGGKGELLEDEARVGIAPPPTENGS